ncbi:ABC-2 type transport system ATP-binding protein [Pseudoclavibacter sp. JAI123]|uniref:ABC transporter ATP-binding protein n=1 Tax=Pseudoclavibacter sp. JAI123 TaxID=2723065 RepID=UPI0015CD52C5|nr:ABC transporter ATP-binding protein [Pseudoclavibacter sp. JAI123]NYF12344.1 ABC-2 type transport system ATP-binding protein [Pseudoclavibacter sp. JAI123]
MNAQPANARLASARPSTIVEVDEVVKRFGQQAALDGVSLNVTAGECVGLLGPNGAGKTTLLSLLLGLRSPTTGTVRLFGGDPLDVRTRIRVGSTPQASALPEALKVAEVLDYVAAHYPQPAARNELVDAFDLGPLLGKQCGSLSGGQQRRLAVALSFVGDPDLVLLDEPTTGLDVDARRSLWDALRAKHRAGCAVIVTSHHLEEIEQLAERVVVIDHGSVITDGSLASVVGSVSRRRVTMRGVDAARIQAIDADALTEAADAGLVTALVRDSDAFIRSLVASGAPFTDLTVRGATLEEAFLAMTQNDEASPAVKSAQNGR